MRILRWGIIGLLLFGWVGSAGAQTITQCKADKDAWLNTYQTDVVRLGYQTLVDRANEMSKCGIMYIQARDWSSDAVCVTLMAEYEEECLNRLGHFLNRRNGYAVFLAEDQRGAR